MGEAAAVLDSVGHSLAAANSSMLLFAQQLRGFGSAPKAAAVPVYVTVGVSMQRLACCSSVDAKLSCAANTGSGAGATDERPAGGLCSSTKLF